MANAQTTISCINGNYTFGRYTGIRCTHNDKDLTLTCAFDLKTEKVTIKVNQTREEPNGRGSCIGILECLTIVKNNKSSEHQADNYGKIEMKVTEKSPDFIKIKKITYEQYFGRKVSGRIRKDPVDFNTAIIINLKPAKVIVKQRIEKDRLAREAEKRRLKELDQQKEISAYNYAIGGTHTDCEYYIAKWPNGSYINDIKILHQQKLKQEIVKWDMGDQLCWSKYGSSSKVIVNIENFNSAKTKFQVRVSNLKGDLNHNGAKLYKQDLIWITPMEGNWKRCD